jgi:TRAP transporter TAXI family solute receptor
MFGRMIRGVKTVIGALAMLAALSTASAAWAQAATLGTNPPGSVFYAIASGLTKVAADGGGVQLTVQPYSGTSTFVPLLESGEVEFGVNNAVDMGLAQRGPAFKIGGRNPFTHAPSLRLVMRIAPLVVAPLVRRDSPIKTMQDVRGKRVTGEYPANLAIWYNVFGQLSSAGLAWSDVRVIPVPGLNEGIDALVQGRADVSSYALNSAKVKEADAAVGLRHLSIDCSPEGERRLRAAVPGYYPRRLKKGEGTAVLEDICVIGYDVYLVAGKSAGDKTVESLLTAIWDNAGKLTPYHPVLRDFTREQMVTSDITIPYHPAAARFFRERGAWTPETEQAQQRATAGR